MAAKRRVFNVRWFPVRLRCAAERIACRPEMRQLADDLLFWTCAIGQPIRRKRGRVGSAALLEVALMFWGAFLHL